MNRDLARGLTALPRTGFTITRRDGRDDGNGGENDLKPMMPGFLLPTSHYHGVVSCLLREQVLGNVRFSFRGSDNFWGWLVRDHSLFDVLERTSLQAL